MISKIISNGNMLIFFLASSISMDLRDDIEYLRSEFRIEKSYSLIHDQNTIIMMILNDLIYLEFGYELGLSAGHSSRVTRTSSYS